MNEFKEYKRCCYRKAIVAGVTFILFENSENTEQVYLFLTWFLYVCILHVRHKLAIHIWSNQSNHKDMTKKISKYSCSWTNRTNRKIGQLDKVGSWFYESKQKEGNVVSIIQVELVGNNIIQTRREWRNLAQTQWKKTNSLEKAVGNNAVDTKCWFVNLF
jgi:hypothetical protein